MQSKCTTAYRVTETILQKLTAATGQYADVTLVPLGKPITQREGAARAKELGKQQGADLVIWGWYGKTKDRVPVSVNVEILTPVKDRLPLAEPAQGEIRTLSIAALERFEL